MVYVYVYVYIAMRSRENRRTVPDILKHLKLFISTSTLRVSCGYESLYCAVICGVVINECVVHAHGYCI